MLRVLLAVATLWLAMPSAIADMLPEREPIATASKQHVRRGRTARVHRVQITAPLVVGGGLLAQATSTIGMTASQLGVPSSLWCADAMNVWLRRAGFSPSGSRWARGFVPYGSLASGPAVGAIAVFPRGRNPRNGHVGVIEAVEGDKIRVVSGNCGRRVCVSTYPVSRAIAFRWPVQ